MEPMRAMVFCEVIVGCERMLLSLIGRDSGNLESGLEHSVVVH